MIKERLFWSLPYLSGYLESDFAHWWFSEENKYKSESPGHLVISSTMTTPRRRELVLLVICCALSLVSCYNIDDEAPYLAAFDQIINASYSFPRPDALTAACVQKSAAPNPLPQVTPPPPQFLFLIVYSWQITVTSNVNAAKLQSICGANSLCVINPGVTVTLDGNVNVAALINRVSSRASASFRCWLWEQGTIIWNDSTQQADLQYLCGGYIVSEGDAVFNLTLTTRSKTAFIYIKDNGALHTKEGARAFGK